MNRSCTDYDGDGVFTIVDVIILYSFVEASNNGWLTGNPASDIATVQFVYDMSYKSTFGSVVITNIPTTTAKPDENDFDEDGNFTIIDVVIYYCYVVAVNNGWLPSQADPTKTEADDIPVVQLIYDTDYSSTFGSATVKQLPQLICITPTPTPTPTLTPTPTPTPTPTHCYNHPDAVLNQTQNTFHCSIQGAITYANSGDIIQVPSGNIYEEQIFIDKSIIIHSDTTNPANYATVSNIGLPGASETFTLSGDINVRISNLRVESASACVLVTDCLTGDVMIDHNTLQNSPHALLVSSSANVSLSSCSTATQDWHVFIDGGENIRLCDNQFNVASPTPTSGELIYIKGSGLIDSNTMNSTKKGIWLDGGDISVSSNIMEAKQLLSDFGILITSPTGITTIHNNILGQGSKNFGATTVWSQTDNIVDATLNYWSADLAPDTPAIKITKTDHDGDGRVGAVDFSPWYTDLARTTRRDA